MSPNPPRRPPGVVFWFRSDLRLHDQLALAHAVQRAQALGGWLLPVYVQDPTQGAITRWGFERTGAHRQAWLQAQLQDLAEQLAQLNNPLQILTGTPAQVLADLVGQLGHPHVVCEHIAAPYELRDVQDLRQRGVQVHTVWQSSLLDPAHLPFGLAQLPDTFTVFRQAIEAAGVQAPPPLPAPVQLPHPPSACAAVPQTVAARQPLEQPPAASQWPNDLRSAFPCQDPPFQGGERAALAHLHRYCQRGLPHSYKATRNGLIGVDYSSKWSPWLATGALSARQAWAAIAAFEQAHGATESTYWLWFELLWRDHFRFLHHKHGARLYRAGGLGHRTTPAHKPEAFDRWREGRTGNAWIDAGMRELAATGYLSNRMRQNVASYLIHDLGCDWRAGAAWFEARLLDYDVYSNQGNWLYLSGGGTDPRGSRRFNPEKQARDHDPHGTYRQLWAPSA